MRDLLGRTADLYRMSRMNRTVYYCGLALLLSLALAGSALGSDPERAVSRPNRGRVLADLPREIDREARYLFYLHGAIVEEQGVRPVSPRFGVYEYEAILDSLAAGGLMVISEARGPQTNGAVYAEGVAAQIDTLLHAGVPPEHVSVVGFSKGGAIALVVSSLMANDRLNFVFLASCLQWVPGWQDLKLRGRVLAVYERSDSFTDSCGDALRSREGQITYEQIELQLGGGHGAFYRPVRQWLDPVVAWVTGATPAPRQDR